MRIAKFFSYTSFFIVLILIPGISLSDESLAVFSPTEDEIVAQTKAACRADPPSCGIESREEIVAEAQKACKADPESCDITLASLLEDTGFAETEPNNYILSADPLVTDTKYWGQLYGAEDQDWYYITTTEPNQIVSVDFSVPGLENITGWNISIRDSGGNIYSQVNTGAGEGSESILKTALSHTGTYYIVVKALQQGDQATYLPYDYNIAAFLDSSKMTSIPIDVNFFDTEVEPNNFRFEANPLTSNVTMTGLLSSRPTFGSPGFEYEDDWFVYASEGNEVLNIGFCTRRDCEGDNWQVTLFNKNGIVLAQGITEQKKYYLGIRNPGRYFFKVSAVVPPKANADIKPEWQQYNFTVTNTKLPPLMSKVKSP